MGVTAVSLSVHLCFPSDCVDPWEPKVLRAGAGTHFHAASIVSGISWELIGNYMSSGARVVLVDQRRSGISDAKTKTGDQQSSTASQTVSEEFPCSDKQTLDAASSEAIREVDLDNFNCSLDKEIVVVVCDESVGADTNRFIVHANGHRLRFPFRDDVKIGNTAVLGSVALFEIVRQLRLSI